MLNYTSVILSGALFGLLIALSVGPVLFALIRFSINSGYKAGIAFILGVSAADIIYVLIANMATNWLKFIEDHQKIIGVIGGLLFIAIGLYGLLTKYKPRRTPRKTDAEVVLKKRTYLAMWLSGFIMNFLNPAALILWLGAAIQIAKLDYNKVETTIFFAIALSIILAGDIAKVFLANKIRTWLTPRKVFYVNKISALVIIIFGVVIMSYQLLY